MINPIVIGRGRKHCQYCAQEGENDADRQCPIVPAAHKHRRAQLRGQRLRMRAMGVVRVFV